MYSDGAVRDSLDPVDRTDKRERSLLLLATNRKWLRSALDEVLAPEGFRLVHVSDTEGLLRKARRQPPSLVIIDEELPGLNVSDTARDLIEGPLEEATPLLLYTSSAMARGRLHTRAYQVGFWDLLMDPLRPETLVSRLRRLLALGDRITRAALQDRYERVARSADPSSGLMTLQELSNVLPSIGALAEREQAPVSIVLLGPTAPEGQDPATVETETASVLATNVRQADLCAAFDGDEVAIVAYDTTADEARELVRRLDEQTTGRTDGSSERVDRRISAAIVELRPSAGLKRAVQGAGRGTGGRGHREVTLDQIIELFHLRDAENALREARRTGGGIRVIDVA